MIITDNQNEHRSGSNNSRGGSPVKDAHPQSPSSSNQMNSQGARKNSSNVASSQNKVLSSPHHKDSSNNLAKSDLNIVSIISFSNGVLFRLKCNLIITYLKFIVHTIYSLGPWKAVAIQDRWKI